MNVLKCCPSTKIVLIIIALIFAPHSLNNCYNHYVLGIDKDFFISLALMACSFALCFIIIRYYQKDATSILHKILSKVENLLSASHSAKILVFCFFCVLVSVSLVSVLVYDCVPRVSDEIAQLFQARIFLSGHLTAPSPPLPEFFTYADDNMIVAPKWYCQYPPGFSFLLSIGLWLGSPWIINPLLAAVSVILVYFLCNELYGKKPALLAALLFILSPKMIFTSGSLMNHTAAMFFLLLAITSMLFAVKKHNVLLALCSGLSLGACLTIRPLDAVVLFLPVGFYSLLMLFKNRKLLALGGGWFCGFCIMACFFLYYNYQTNGDPLTLGYVMRWGGNSHLLGFHEVRGGIMHTPLTGLIKSIWQIKLNDKALLEWPVPASFFILLLVLFARKTVWDFLLISIILLNVTIYFFWGWSDLAFMGRFYFISLPYFIILVTRGIQCFGELCSRNWNTDPIDLLHAKPASAGIVALVLFLFAGITRTSDLVPQYYLSVLEVDRRIEDAVKKSDVRNAIVFIEPQDRVELIVGSGFFMNTPDLAAQAVIFAKDLGEHNKRLLLVYPGRKGYLYRHRRDKEKKFQWGNCISPPEAFELIELNEHI